MKSGVALLGGFAGNESNLSQRNWQANVTSLDATGKASSVVYSPPGIGLDAKIDGFTITNGMGYQFDIAGDGLRTYGGGIFCNNSSPTISNNAVVANSAYGSGGIHCHNSASPVISNNRIEGNFASAVAGAVWASAGSAPIIKDNSIKGNEANASAGAIAWTESSGTMSGNVITGNKAAYHGAFYLRNSSPEISNNTISNNTAYSARFITYCRSSSPLISNNIFSGNSAWDTISCEAYSSPIITNNTFVGNPINT